MMLSGLVRQLWVKLAGPVEVAEPAEPASRVVEAAGVTIDADEEQWRRLTGDSTRDLQPVKQDRMQKMAVYLWESNPLANRLIELPVAYLLAGGAKLTVPDEDAQEILTRFWHDPINEMDLKLPKKVRELSLYGEQCYPTFVNVGNGHLRLGYLDPVLIGTVVMDPDNSEQPIGVVTKKDRKGNSKRFKILINGEEDVFTEKAQRIRATFTDGECFFFKVNDLSNSSRGRSDLLAEMDWLDGYDQFLFGELDRAALMRMVLWDVTLKGSTPDEVKKRSKEIAPPTPNSVRVHNDSEEWKAEVPSLGAYDASTAARLFRNHVLGGKTVPSHWFGGGEDVNRAAAAEMGGPTIKMFSMRQSTLKYMLQSMGRQALWQAKEHGQLKAFDMGKPEFQVSAEFPEMETKDVTKLTAALASATTGAVLMAERGLVQQVTAVRIVAKLAAELGVEFDAEEEFTKAQAEVKKIRAEQARNDTNLPTVPGTEDEADDDLPAAA